MHSSSNFYILLQIQMILYNNICMISSLFFTLSLSLSLPSDYNHHCFRIVVVIDPSVGRVGHHHPFSHFPTSILLFHKLHLLDLDCCDGCRGQGGSLMLVLLGFVLGFGSNNFGGCCGQRGQLVSMWVFARSKVDLFWILGQWWVWP